MSQEEQLKTAVFNADWVEGLESSPRTWWQDDVVNLIWFRQGIPPEQLSFVAWDREFEMLGGSIRATAPRPPKNKRV